MTSPIGIQQDWRMLPLHRTALLLIVSTVILKGCSGSPLPVVSGVTLELAQHRSATISDINYRLHFSIPERIEGPVNAHADITFMLTDNFLPLQLDFRESPDRIKKVVSNGVATPVSISDEHLVLPASVLQPGSNRLEIDFVAGDSSLNRNPEFLYTLFVPDRARTAFPLFDQPDLKARYELTLELPAAWIAMSAAPVASDNISGERRTVTFRRSDLMSSYLFSFVAGRFELVERVVDGRSMTLLHRETDAEKLRRNIDAVFQLHADSLAWLEEFTAIDYPYQKFGFALIPDFQYGGMEHVGAIQYRATSLLLDEAPSDNELLSRAGLIAHETAHMWFGNLVTMRWFNDVWTKEVFANFMAAKIVNPQFPDIDHDLNFLVRHYPSAYSVDRTPGANAIRQHLPNLNEAGQMYGAIIYNKAPIMMRELESLIGADNFRDGLQEYLDTFAFSNAGWPDLIDILQQQTADDLAAWSEVWVNSPGRPEFSLASARAPDEPDLILQQRDPSGAGRIWPQAFELGVTSSGGTRRVPVLSSAAATPIDSLGDVDVDALIFSADGRGYGRFPAFFPVLRHWQFMSDVEQGATLINLHEQMLDGGEPAPGDYLQALLTIVELEDNELLLNLAVGQLEPVFWQLLPEQVRMHAAADVERRLWDAMLAQPADSTKKMFFKAFAALAISKAGVSNLYEVWTGEQNVSGLVLSENDRIALAEALAIRMPESADAIISAQLAQTENPDSVRRLTFVAPSVSASQQVRDRFFSSLAEPEMRTTESWVLAALRNLHHPLRRGESEHYLRPALDLLQEIQITGDIFFPKRWLDENLKNYNSATAKQTVDLFLAEHPDYNEQLLMKIRQSADTLYRANKILQPDTP